MEMASVWWGECSLRDFMCTRERKWRWLWGSSCLSCFSQRRPAPPPRLHNQPIRTEAHTHTHRCANTDITADEQFIWMQWVAPRCECVHCEAESGCKGIWRLSKKKEKKTCLYKSKGGKVAREASTGLVFKIIVSPQLIQLQTNCAHTPSSLFDREWKLGSVTGSLSESVVLEERIQMMKDDSVLFSTREWAATGHTRSRPYIPRTRFYNLAGFSTCHRVRRQRHITVRSEHSHTHKKYMTKFAAHTVNVPYK